MSHMGEADVLRTRIAELESRVEHLQAPTSAHGIPFSSAPGSLDRQLHDAIERITSLEVLLGQRGAYSDRVLALRRTIEPVIIEALRQHRDSFRSVTHLVAEGVYIVCNTVVSQYRTRVTNKVFADDYVVLYATDRDPESFKDDLLMVPRAAIASVQLQILAEVFMVHNSGVGKGELNFRMTGAQKLDQFVKAIIDFRFGFHEA
jgi:hypothetical protein